MSWIAKKCQHAKMGLASGCEECYENHAALTSKASERVTLESVVSDLMNRAANYFKTDEDENARLLRSIALDYRKKVTVVSDEQSKLLKEMGYP